MKIGILGFGEVGQAIKEAYLKAQGLEPAIVLVNDKKAEINEFEKGMKFLHICIPYSENFIKDVAEICSEYEPEYCIIHSSVPVGTTSLLNAKFNNFVHSPVRGVHPKLYDGVMTFVKFIGADDPEIVGNEVARHFQFGLGFAVAMFNSSKVTELGKLLDTTYYGLCIAFHDYADRLCEKEGLDFDFVMTTFNKTYNDGYKLLGMPNVVRPVLYSPQGKIGGHCVVPNAEILKEQFGSDEILESILKLK